MGDGFGHLRITLATPVLLALSAARITRRCSPGESPVRSRANFSLWESITPSTDSIGTQLLASSEYSQRRSALARSLASHSDRKSTRLNSSHLVISYAVFCLQKKT